MGNRTKIDIALKSSSVDIDEVVVTGYQNLKKQTFTGSSVKLNASDLNVAGTSDISRMLEGKAAGVSVQNVSGTFGAAPKVRIRGVASITGDNKPLWVVDGVVLEDMVNVSNDQLSSGDPTTLLGSSVAGINAEDIETFDILKDAAATAMYGARAMNGVIVITTSGARVRSSASRSSATTATSRSARSLVRSVQYHELVRPDVRQCRNGTQGVAHLADRQSVFVRYVRHHVEFDSFL